MGVFDDDYGGFYGYDDDYYGGYGYDYYGYGDDDDDFLAPVCEKGTDCTDCGGADPDAPTVECTNTCQWANDDYCDDTRTSGLCDLGTDCHDCGPASKGNFTTLDDVKGVGGVFMMLLVGIVVGVGALMCAIGSWI